MKEEVHKSIVPWLTLPCRYMKMAIQYNTEYKLGTYPNKPKQA